MPCLLSILSLFSNEFNKFNILFGLILYVLSTIFQLYRDRSSWVEPVLSLDKCVLLKDHNAVTPVRLELAALWSWVKHSTTELLRFLTNLIKQAHECLILFIRWPINYFEMKMLNLSHYLCIIYTRQKKKHGIQELKIVWVKWEWQISSLSTFLLFSLPHLFPIVLLRPVNQNQCTSRFSIFLFFTCTLSQFRFTSVLTPEISSRTSQTSKTFKKVWNLRLHIAHLRWRNWHMCNLNVQ